MGHCIPDASSPNGIQNKYFYYLYQWIYSFHMPLFFFISGYLTYKIKSKVTITDRLKKYAKRLLVPYFVVGICYCPFKVLLSNFANKPYDVSEIWKIMIGINPDGELWFLYALFGITAIVLLVEKFPYKLLLAIAIGYFFIPNKEVPFSYLSFLYIFLFGYYTRQYGINLFSKFSGNLYLMVCIILFLVGYYMIANQHVGEFKMLTSVTGVWLAIRFSNYICSTYFNSTIVNCLKVCGIYSMDIYILSDIIKIPFRIVLWNKFHLYEISFLVGTVASVVLSYLLSKYIIRKNNLLKKLVLGMS